MNLIKRSELSRENKGDFIATVKNIQTEEQFKKALPVFEERIGRLVEETAERKLTKDIRKELKNVKLKKKAGKPTGKFTAGVQESLDLMRKASFMFLARSFTFLISESSSPRGGLPCELFSR